LTQQNVIRKQTFHQTDLYKARAYKQQPHYAYISLRSRLHYVSVTRHNTLLTEGDEMYLFHDSDQWSALPGTSVL